MRPPPFLARENKCTIYGILILCHLSIFNPISLRLREEFRYYLLDDRAIACEQRVELGIQLGALVL